MYFYTSPGGAVSKSPSNIDDNEKDDKVVNQMIARSEEEFQQMEIERHRADAELRDHRKLRLIKESELPDCLTQDTEDMEREEEETTGEKIRQEEMGRGNRSRKDVAHQEQLSEKGWMKANGAEEGSSDDERCSNIDMETPSMKKKKKGKRDYDNEEPQKKKGCKKLCKKMKKLMEVVMQYEDSDGRVLSEPFWKLPSRKELPDYYEVRQGNSSRAELYSPCLLDRQEAGGHREDSEAD